MARLRGTTWAHSRGYLPLVAAAQAVADFHPETEIVWERRSLWAFGEGPLDELAAAYDLLVFDYPLTGLAAERGLFLPLDEHLPPSLLDEQRAQSVGPSYRSFSYGGHQWGLPVDAAAQASVSRPDLLARDGLTLPQTWAEVVDLARETRRVAVPLSPMGTLASFFSLCANQGEPPLADAADRVVSRPLGEHVLDQLRTLYAFVDPALLGMSPVATLNAMASTDAIVYVPLTYGYCTYARRGYAPHPLTFGPIPDAGGQGHDGATLGGAGIAVSARSAHRAEALAHVVWLTSADCQRSLYTLSGGQPANRLAWKDDLANRVTGNFFRDLLPTLDAAYLRPNHPGFHEFQSRAAPLLQAFLRAEERAADVLDGLDRLAVTTRTSTDA